MGGREVGGLGGVKGPMLICTSKNFLFMLTKRKNDLIFYSLEHTTNF